MKKTIPVIGMACSVCSANVENIRDYLDSHANAGDLVVTIGSGDVYIQTKKLL